MNGPSWVQPRIRRSDKHSLPSFVVTSHSAEQWAARLFSQPSDLRVTQSTSARERSLISALLSRSAIDFRLKQSWVQVRLMRQCSQHQCQDERFGPMADRHEPFKCSRFQMGWCRVSSVLDCGQRSAGSAPRRQNGNNLQGPKRQTCVAADAMTGAGMFVRGVELHRVAGSRHGNARGELDG